jgi:hypothetical protein
MRRQYPCVLLVLAACAHSTPSGGGDAGDDDVGAPDAGPRPDAAALDAGGPDAVPLDGGVEARSFTDDVASDFAATALTDSTVEDFGAIAPIAYHTGGLLQHGSDDGYFTDGAGATWAQVQTFTPTTRTAITWLTQGFWGPDTPPSVGLTSGDFFSEWFEGEVFLDVGTWTFTLLVDDHGFVEVAAPGTAAFQRVLSANWATEASGNVVAATAGWYPIRYAIAEEAGDAQYNLRLSGPGVTAQPIPRDRMRVRADRLTGLLEAGFDDARGAGDVETTVDQITPGYTNWDVGNPGDLGMTASDTFSVRWSGQVRIDVGGDYSFRLATDDGQRLWIDGLELLDTWGDTTANTVTGTITLNGGWHDLVIEQTENGGGAAAFLTVETGPAMVGQALPVAILRPVEGRADRIAAGVNHTDVAIPDNTTVSSSVVLSAPPGATVTSLDLDLDFAHTYVGDLTFTLQAPNGVTATVVDYADTDSTDGRIERITSTALNGQPVNGTWTLSVNDHQTTDTGTLNDFAITPHWNGGQAPIPTASSFDSTVRDLGAGVTAIDAVTWDERLPTGADIAVRVRTCAVATACAAAPWSVAITTPGGAPAVAPAQFLQYRVELSSNGDRAPILDRLRVDYRVGL